MKNPQAIHLVWFRQDLRLSDHPALYHAMAEGDPVVALFTAHPQQHERHSEAPLKYDFYLAHVLDLVDRLKKLGVGSVIKELPWFDDVPAFLSDLCAQLPVKHLSYHASYWPNEVKRDQQVVKVLTEQGVNCHSYHATNLLKPGTVRKSDGNMYHVFTPYKNKYLEALKANHQWPLPVPAPQTENTTELPELKQLGDEVNVDFDHAKWPVGEAAAVQRLKDFVVDNDYQKYRDLPAIRGTSRLSPYLFNGAISVKTCLAHQLKQEGEAAFDSTWVSELIWRDFYHDLMFEYPKLAKHQTFKEDAVDEWLNQPEVFEQWQQGQTGFPIVDAGMRQMLAEGWMHNRVRMIVASFLTKLCLIDWRLGEAHFMQHLLDGDLASNNGGWQWSSATGCDAAPYFRIFNPTTQSKKFDPEGEYIKKYVPELRDCDAKTIHDPAVGTRQQLGYPEPIIDYKSARQQALDWFKK